MLLSQVVEASRAVAATRSRREKTSVLAGVLRECDPEEVPVVVGLLTGEPRQGKVGVGPALVTSLEVDPASSGTLTVREVDATAGALAAVAGPGSAGARTERLGALLERATVPEQEYLKRLLVGEVRQGALRGLMVEAVARAAGVPAAEVRRAHMLAGDLGVVAARALAEGTEGLRRISLQVLRPLEPMLAASAGDIAAALEATGEAAVEWKLDGARLQAHALGDEVRLYTRNLNDVTERLPEVVQAVRDLRLGAVVLDGEAIALDGSGRPRPFHETMSRFGTEEPEGGPLHVFFFDVLHLDGEDLIDLSLRRRLERLDAAVPETLRVGRILTTDAAEAGAFLDDALGRGHEGVMVKALDAPYQAGRRGSAWQKVKPSVTLDLVVLGAEWGYGRRTGWLSNLHLGARAGDGFVMLGKTFKGMTDEMLAWQTERFLELEVRRTSRAVYVRPELVVEVAVDAVVPSSRYPGGVTLRFARVKGYREDKNPSEADTIEAVRGLVR